MRQEGDGVAFAVRDNGVGLAPEDLDRIFDMFEQTRTIGEPTGGLGLGLHLTRAVAQLHGGSVRASSPGPGRGSEFVLRLPVVPCDLQPSHADLRIRAKLVSVYQPPGKGVNAHP